YFRPITASTGNSVVTGGKRQVMIGSNNYLGLTHDPRVMEAAKIAVDKYGTGCTGSRFLNGNLDIHEELEARLAKFVGKEAALCFSTGFFVNQGTLGALVGRSDVIYSDRENHASIVEGTQVALGDTLRYRHNDIADLERILKSTREKYEGAIIVADGVFSMSGDILKLPEITALAKQYNCKVYVDDAHSLGVLGERGEGTAQHFNIHKDVDLVMGTFSKSFASIGGFIAGPADVIHYIKHKARPFIFSAAMAPSATATALKCLDIMETEPQHIQKLRENSAYMSKNLRAMGFHTLNSHTPIIPLLIGDDAAAFMMTQKLCAEGVFVTPVVRPAVPEGCALIRTSYMATHTRADLDYALEHLEHVGKTFGILGNAETTEKLNKLTLENFGAHALS
ncbi:MAG: aminotransferase class I/II-fold pyridoxal phosphate-dependent enzyme, partial [Bdellovibrionales bacterium]|nr:aminotransferase class I/II-fold pyridoxal phosphate-dependent enzyme [Oligoflexia bacterium]